MLIAHYLNLFYTDYILFGKKQMKKVLEMQIYKTYSQTFFLTSHRITKFQYNKNFLSQSANFLYILT
jgi:hypothetical protein